MLEPFFEHNIVRSIFDRTKMHFRFENLSSVTSAARTAIHQILQTLHARYYKRYISIQAFSQDIPTHGKLRSTYWHRDRKRLYKS